MKMCKHFQMLICCHPMLPPADYQSCVASPKAIMAELTSATLKKLTSNRSCAHSAVALKYS